MEAGSIKFEGIFGDEIKKVEISRPMGTSSYTFDILINNYYRGVINFRNGKWDFSGPARFIHEITAADLEEIIQRIADAGQLPNDYSQAKSNRDPYYFRHGLY